MDVVIRDVNDILKDVNIARTSKKVIETPLEQLIMDLEVILGEFIVDLSKFKENNKSAGVRARKYSIALETLGLSFRKASI